ncbi:MAG: very short patch repair endonuclease [Acetatifactor sp.]|nr:very short patch repair endonuclease [Acetatifactor sp.]
MNKREPRFRGEASDKSHKNMSRIRGKDTSIEVTLRRALWKKGYRYRKNYTELPGRPDIALTKYKIAIFCDSEFFHGKDWEVLRPKLEKGKNPDYWIPKIERNMERDKEKDSALLFADWTVIHFWGKDILQNTDECVKVIEEIIFEQKIQRSEDDGSYD